MFLAQVRLPFSKEGLKVALLNAERYADRNVERQIAAKKVEIPERWKKEIEELPRAPTTPGIDFDSLIKQVEMMSADEFSKTDIDALLEKHATR
jgi:hypothetical protein